LLQAWCLSRPVALLRIDGSLGEGGGQTLRTALSLSAATGQGFELTNIRARRSKPGMRPQHVAAVRALGLCCGARVGGAFDGSPDLRFEPGPVAAGDFRFEIGTAGSTALVLQTVLVALAVAPAASRVAVEGGTHVPLSPSADYLARHWATAVERLGLHTTIALVRAGFYPRGGGEASGEVEPWARPATAAFDQRGPLLRVRGISGAGRLRGDVARRQRDAAQQVLWEVRRLEAEWEVREVPAESPGSFLLLEAVFETGRGAFGFLGERGLSAERLGARSARRLLRFLDDDQGAVDPQLADQLAVPLALARGGGRVTTPEVTLHLETAASVLRLFGIPAETWGRVGGPGGLEVGRC
jgi:RNA 3'-terminal phosphate cyclase (ATP)